MTDVRCVNIMREKTTGRIKGYVIQFPDGAFEVMEPNQVRNAILAGHIKVDRLSVSKTGRIVCHKSRR